MSRLTARGQLEGMKGIYVYGKGGTRSFYHSETMLYPAFEKLAKLEDLQEQDRLMIVGEQEKQK